MSRDGNGTFSLVAGNPVVTETVISSTTFNATLSDVGAALTQSVSKDGQTTMTANQNMGGFRHTNIDVATARNQYAAASQVQDSSFNYVNAVSGTDTITGTLSPAITAYATGLRLTLIPLNNNAGAATLALNGLAAKAIVKQNAAVLVAGDLVAGVPAELSYNGTTFTVLNPQRVETLGVTSNAQIGGTLTAGATTLASSTITGNETIGGNLTVTGTITVGTGGGTGGGIPETSIVDGALLARNAGNEAITGTWSFTINPTIAGQTNWHSGNDGNGSGLDADVVRGIAPATAATASTLAQRDVSADLFSRYLNTSAPNSENPSLSQFMVTNGSDNYLRKCSAASVVSQLSLVTQSAGFVQARVLQNSATSGYTQDGMYIGYANGSSGATHIYGGGSTTSNVTIDGSGNLVASGNVTASSDARLKTNIERIAGALDKVRALRGVTFHRTDLGIDQAGVIAQDVQAVLPLAVMEDERGFLAVSYGALTGLLIESINELAAEVELLRKVGT
jgi:hypothetical protein